MYQMKSERIRLGLSIEEVSEKIGIHPNTIRGYESGATQPSGKNLISLAHLYGCSPEYLLGMTDERKTAVKA